MNLNTKLIVAIAMILSLTFVGVTLRNYYDEKRDAEANLLEQAERIRNLLMAFRRTQQNVFLDLKVPLNDVTLHFLPAFAVGKISQEYTNWDKSGFSFENVSDQPRNLQHRADALELQIMEYFRKNPTEEVYFQPFKKPTGEQFYLYARPVWIEQYCIKCHGKREDAPETIRNLYDTAWNYQVGDLRGLLSIKLPARTIVDRTLGAFWQNLIIEFVAFLIIFILIIWILRHNVSRPLHSLVQNMQAVAGGDYSGYIQGFKGEFGKLSQAFNEMIHKISEQQSSLRELNTQLEQRVIQRTQELQQANSRILELNEQLKAENIRMGAELEVTRHLQQMMLPKSEELHDIKELDIAGFMEPATEVGGDYYDVLQHEGRIKIGIGDVTGHGLESGVLMLMVQTAVRTLLANNVTDPKVFLTVLNQALFLNLQRMKSDKNLTLSLLDYQDGKLRLSGQHEEILLVRYGGEVERINTFDLGFIVGVEADISQFIVSLDIFLEMGDGVVLYTDGVTEAQNQEKQQYSVERLSQIVSKHWHLSATEIQQAIVADLRQHAGDILLKDDITLLVIKQR